MSTEPNNSDPKDLSVNIRMLIAFALAGLVIFGWQYVETALGIKRPEKPPQQQTAVESKPNTPATPAAAAAVPAPKPAQGEPASVATTAASSQKDVVIDTDLYHIVFSNQGAVVKNWTLKKFPDHAGKPLDVVNTAAAPKTGFPFQYDFRGAKTPADLNQALFVDTPSPDGLGVTFEYSNGGVTAHKSFTFKRNSYLVDVASSVTFNGEKLQHLLSWRGGFGDMAVPNAASQESEVYFDSASRKVEREKVKSADGASVNQDGGHYLQKHWYGVETSEMRPNAATFGWVGLEDQYFAAIFLPAGGATLRSAIFDDKATVPQHSEESFLGLGVGSGADNRMSLFIGPKDPDTLANVDPKLSSIINFGFFWFIARPLFNSLHWIYDNWFHNYGWSIIVATVIINLVLFPLKLANLKSMRKMQALQPEIAKINEKYKSLPLRDPKQADKNAEMMALYSKAGTNPMSGCIPMLVQMPFLWAFYTVLSVSIALRGANWLWVGDLSQPEQIPIRVLPVLLVITGFVMQKMTPMTTVDPSQQKTMMLMPLMMGFIFYQASSGLVLYWLTSNFVGIAQQWLLNKAMPKPETPPPSAKDVKKSSNRK